MAELDHSTVSRHRSTIIGCLKESDPSIRRRALEVVFALVNLKNVEELVRELLNYLVGKHTGIIGLHVDYGRRHGAS